MLNKKFGQKHKKNSSLHWASTIILDIHASPTIISIYPVLLNPQLCKILMTKPNKQKNKRSHNPAHYHSVITRSCLDIFLSFLILFAKGLTGDITIPSQPDQYNFDNWRIKDMKTKYPTHNLFIFSILIAYISAGN